MKKEKLTLALIFAVALTLSTTFAATTNSTTILFVGKVFSEKLSGDLLGDVQISIKCSSSTFKGKTDNSSSKGSYAILVPSDNCTEGSPLSYTLSKSGYKTQTFSGFYDHTNLSNPNFIKVGEDEVFVVNFILQKQNQKSTHNSGGSHSGGSSSGGGSCKSLFWDCSSNWTKCTNGTQTRQCVSNCRDIKTETRNCSSSQSNKTQNSLNATGEINTKTEESSGGFLSKITGAFAGPTGKKKLTVVILILLAIIGFYGLLRGKEEEEEEEQKEDKKEDKNNKENEEKKEDKKEEKPKKEPKEKKEE